MNKHIEVVNHHGNQYSLDIRENGRLIKSEEMGSIGAEAAMDIAKAIAAELGINDVQDWT